MGLKVTNNAFGTLNAGINSSATTIVLASGQGARFPSLGAGDYFYATLIDTSNNLEIVKVTARSTDTMTVVRGQDSTTARAYSTNDRFELRPTAVMLNEITLAAENALPKTGGVISGSLRVGNAAIVDDEPFAVLSSGGHTMSLKNSNSVNHNQIIFDGNQRRYQFGVGNSGTGTPGANKFYAFSNITSRFGWIMDDNGVVQMPFQPAFKCAWNSRNSTGSGRIISTNSGDSIATGRDEFNRGSHFSSTTGRFTCPVAGVYLMGFQAMRNQTNGTQLECRIYKNGSIAWARAYRSSYNNDYEYWSIVTISNCSAGDYFEVFLGPSSSIYNDDTYSYGYFIG